MNKVVELLEQHCQWLAIGVGGLFLAYIVWAYVLVSPVAVEVPGQGTLTPGNVDVEVNNIARTVQDRMDSKQLGKVPDMRQSDPLEVYVKVMNGDPDTRQEIAHKGYSSSIPFKPELTDIKDLPKAPDLVAELPETPSAEVLPDAGVKAARVQAIVGPIGGQPGQPLPPAAPGAAPVLPANATDLNYIRGEWRIDPQEIAAAWNKMKVPMGLTTLVLDVKVMRQEQLPDGTWSEAVEVKRLDNGIRHWPVPNRNAGFQAIGQFEAWFAGPQGQSDLLRPPFYQVISGEGPWDPPSNLDDAKAQVKQMSDADRLKKQEDAKQRAADRTRNRPTQPEAPPEFDRPRRGRGRGEPEFKAEDPTRSNSLADLAGLQLAQAYPPGYPPRYPGQPPVNPDDMPADGFGGAGMQPGQPGQPVAPGAGQPLMPALPPAQFDPRQTPAIFGWFFDTNVEEGHTYRYQVLYAIKNPMWQNNQVADPALAQVYSIWSKLDNDAWSEPRTVETTTKFFIADRSWQGNSVPNSVRIEVFKWTGGKWQSRVFSVNAGDQIGWDEVGTDWGTHSRLVDVRFDDRLEKAYLLIMGPDGKMVERDPLSDRIDNNEERQALKFLVQQSQLPVGANAGTGTAPLAGR